MILANELLDNLPAALAVRAGKGWRERRVDVAGSGFRFVDIEDQYGDLAIRVGLRT